MRRQPTLSLLALLLLAGVVAGPARADWLVLKDGSRLETRGAWTVKGDLVVFTQKNGSLASLRASEVDLEPSRAATAESKAPAPAAKPPAPRRAVITLTEKDIPPVFAGAEASGPTGDAKAKGTSPDKKSPEEDALEVADWQRGNLPKGNGTEIVGTVRNRGSAMVTGATISVSLYDEAGGILVTETAELGPSAIAPGKTAAFHVEFPGVLNFTEARFALASRGYRTAQPVPQPGDATAPSGGQASPDAKTTPPPPKT